LISLTQLMKDKPLIHAGRSVTMGIHQDLATFLDESLNPGHVTLETGSGLSTLVILRKQVAQHIAVSPAPDEFEAIRHFCHEHGVDTGPLRTEVARSHDYWPTADLPPLDLVLIDGDHAFPMPFIDWFYTADKLKIGGWMVVDDANIASGTILVDFMRADPKWQEVTRHWSGRFAIYKKLAASYPRRVLGRSALSERHVPHKVGEARQTSAARTSRARHDAGAALAVRPGAP